MHRRAGCLNPWPFSSSHPIFSSRRDLCLLLFILSIYPTLPSLPNSSMQHIRPKYFFCRKQIAATWRNEPSITHLQIRIGKTGRPPRLVRPSTDLGAARPTLLFNFGQCGTVYHPPQQQHTCGQTKSVLLCTGGVGRRHRAREFGRAFFFAWKAFHPAGRAMFLEPLFVVDMWHRLRRTNRGHHDHGPGWEGGLFFCYSFPRSTMSTFGATWGCRPECHDEFGALLPCFIIPYRWEWKI